MGVTVFYRGGLADLTRIEDFEDRLIDFALEFGGLARIWRTWADDNPERVVRGVIVDLARGQEPTSLLLSPEGWLIGLTDIKDAEDGQLTEPPWCFVKTQFGSVEGHVALIEMLAALKREFLPDLEVSDDGGYWETRDLAELVRNHSMTQAAIDGLAEGLRRYGLSSEAAEDPAILLRDVERVAAHVHRNLHRPAEHPPVAVSDDDGELAPRGESVEHDAAAEGARFRETTDDRFKIDADELHPRLQRAMDLPLNLDTLFRDVDPRFASSLGTLYRGAADAMDGLAQALSRSDAAADHNVRVVRLRRALRGAAFARGALFPLRATISAEQFAELFRVLEQLQTDIFSELGRVRHRAN